MLDWFSGGGRHHSSISSQSQPHLTRNCVDDVSGLGDTLHVSDCGLASTASELCSPIWVVLTSEELERSRRRYKQPVPCSGSAVLAAAVKARATGLENPHRGRQEKSCNDVRTPWNVTATVAATVSATITQWTGPVSVGLTRIRDISKIVAPSRGFSGRASKWCQTNSTTTDPCCHDNEISGKIGNNYRLVWETSPRSLHLTGGLGSSYRMMSVKFYDDRPWLPWQRNLRPNRL